MSPIKKIAIVGYGKIGIIYEEILKSIGYEIMICDIYSPLYIQDYKDEGLKICDLIIITTPPSLHFEIAHYFLQFGKRVVIEKPPVINKDQINILKELGGENLIYCAYHTSFNPLFSKINKHIDISSIQSIEIINKEYIYNYHKQDGWITNPEISGGGCLIDNGINSFSVILNLVNSVNFVSGHLESRYIQVEDLVEISLTAKNNNGSEVSIKYISDWFYREKEERKYIIKSKNDILELNIAQNKIFLNGSVVKNDFGDINSVQEVGEYRALVDDVFSYFDTQVSHIKYDKFEPLELVLSCYKLI